MKIISASAVFGCGTSSFPFFINVLILFINADFSMMKEDALSVSVRAEYIPPLFIAFICFEIVS